MLSIKSCELSVNECMKLVHCSRELLVSPRRNDGIGGGNSLELFGPVFSSQCVAGDALCCTRLDTFRLSTYCSQDFRRKIRDADANRTHLKT